MSTTRKKSRIGGTNNRTVHAVGRYAHQPNRMMRMMRKNYDGIAKSARQSYRRANTMARRHPQASLALVLVSLGLVAGVVVGLALKPRWTASRWQSFLPMSL